MCYHIYRQMILSLKVKEILMALVLHISWLSRLMSKNNGQQSIALIDIQDLCVIEEEMDFDVHLLSSLGHIGKRPRRSHRDKNRRDFYGKNSDHQ